MRYTLKFLLAQVLILGFVSCSKDNPPSPEIKITDTNTEYSVDYTMNSSVTVNFTSATSWSLNNVPKELTVSPTSGNSGSQKLTIKTNSGNETNASKSYSFQIIGGEGTDRVQSTVKITQISAFTLSTKTFTVDKDGGQVQVPFTYNGTDDDPKIYISYDGNFGKMWDRSSNNTKQMELVSLEPITRSNWTATFKIFKNPEKGDREGSFCFTIYKDDNGDETYSSEYLTIKQPGAGANTSTDYSEDGKTFTLQTHTKGSGVPIVLMGDGFVDLDFTNGNYKKKIDRAFASLFVIEPLKSLKEYFDVYYVNVVSKNDAYGEGYETALGVQFEGGHSTGISCDDDAVVKYAMKVDALAKNDFKAGNMLMIVTVNDNRYAGTCVIYNDGTAYSDGLTRGYSIALVPLDTSSETGFEHTLWHEALGHGLGKLGDEYGYEENGTLETTSSEYRWLQAAQKYGLYNNVSLESDVTKSPWAQLAADSHYSAEKLGCYEGAFTYYGGVYRPTDDSIMRNNTDQFNAPSRELIYRRTMMIANDGNFNYNYDDFVAFDKPSWSSTSANTRATNVQVDKHLVRLPLGKPIVKVMKK